MAMRIAVPRGRPSLSLSLLLRSLSALSTRSLSASPPPHTLPHLPFFCSLSLSALSCSHSLTVIRPRAHQLFVKTSARILQRKKTSSVRESPHLSPSSFIPRFPKYNLVNSPISLDYFVISHIFPLLCLSQFLFSFYEHSNRARLPFRVLLFSFPLVVICYHSTAGRSENLHFWRHTFIRTVPV